MSEYYASVGAYFDEDAAQFDERYWANPVLQRIRQVFREETKRYRFSRALEIGCGTGIDLVHFARLYPERTFVGVDVSPGMVGLCRARLQQSGLGNVGVEVASADDVTRLTGPAFDLCYVFFGALNTVESLHRAADSLYSVVEPGGHLVLTFVNRWYLAEIAIGLARGRWRRAFARLADTWGGYGPTRRLESRCVSPRQVRSAFGGQGELIATRGFCITYPAWYRLDLLRRLGRVGPWLWELDRLLDATPAWSLGEYALYTFRKRGPR